MAYATSTTNRPAHAAGGPTTAPRPAGRRRFRRAPTCRRRGFTLIEALAASAILAIAVIAIGASLSTTVKQTSVVEEDSTALLLARQLMEEIAAKPFTDPTSGTVTSNATALTNAVAAAAAATGSTPARATYNDVGDYHGYSDTVDATTPIKSLQGKTAAATNGRKYTRAVTVEFRATPAGAAATTGNFALITVTVTEPSKRTVSAWRMAANTTFQQSSTL
jgi:type IV pilus modification protein PilV